MSDEVRGFLEVGTNGDGDVIVNHPDLKPDVDGVGHIVFSPEQADHFARLLTAKALDARRERIERGARRDFDCDTVPR